jgi:cytochrome c1
MDARGNHFPKRFGAGDGDRTARSSLGIKITAPLFSQLTKRIRKNQCAATHSMHAVPDLHIAAGGLVWRFVAETLDRIAGLTQVPLAALCDKVDTLNA